MKRIHIGEALQRFWRPVFCDAANSMDNGNIFAAKRKYVLYKSCTESILHLAFGTVRLLERVYVWFEHKNVVWFNISV